MTQNYQVKVSMNQAAVVKSGLVLKQGDFGMTLQIEVLDFNVSGTTPQIIFRKPMGAVESTSVTNSGNVYTYTFRGTELDTPGKVICDLKLKNSTTQRISSASFSFEVVADTMDGLEEESSSYSDTIAQIAEELKNSTFSVFAADATAIIGTSENHIDLDGYTTPGNYKVTSAALAGYVDHGPTTASAYRLIVLETTLNTRFMQIALMNRGGYDTKISVRLNAGNGWSAWNDLANSNYVDTAVTTLANSIAGDISDLGAASLDLVTSHSTEIPANADLDSYTTPGNYLVKNVATSNTILNAPISEIGYRLFVVRYRADANTTKAQIIISATPNPYIFVRFYNGSLWRPWTRLMNTETDSGIYGITFNTTDSSGTVERIGGYTHYITNFDKIHPWGDMRRCNLSIVNGKKHITYEGENDFATDGSNGNVMVEIPKFFVKRERIGNTESWYISAEDRAGFTIHPWFVNSDGSIAQYRYYGAYNSSNAVSGAYSVSGQTPYSNSGHNSDYYPGEIGGFKRNNWMALNALQYLFCIEYATINVQKIFNGATYSPYFSQWREAANVGETTNTLKVPANDSSFGNSFSFYAAGMQVAIGNENDYYLRNITNIVIAETRGNNQYDYITVDGEPISITNNLRVSGICQKTGRTDTLTTPSGVEADINSKVAAFRYRYIENPWGNIWEMLDGIRYKNGKYYITNDATKFRDADVTNWDELTFDAPAITATDTSKLNWITKMGFDANARQLMLPTILSPNNDGSGDKYYGDAYYSTTSTTSINLPAVGGGWDHHENAGIFCQRYLSISANLNQLYGERVIAD